MCTDCCCCEKESTNKDLARKNVCCTDIAFLIVFIAFWAGMIYMGVFAVRKGDAYRLVFGYDSYGNTCNEDNSAKAVENVTNSGMNVTGNKGISAVLNVTIDFGRFSAQTLLWNVFVFFMDIFTLENIEDSLEICVKQCPDRDLYTPKDVKDFFDRTGSKLCTYDIDPNQYTDESLYNNGGAGPCPALPLLVSTSVVYRCLPDPTQMNNSEVLSKAINLINEDDNVVRKMLSDMYSSWKEMLWMCLVALGISFLTVLLIRFMAAIIVWVTVILAAVSSLVGTGFLWWTYVQVKNDNQRAKEQFDVPLLDVDINNETAFLVFSIIATVFTVLLLLIILILRKRLALVVALFHEAGKCVIAMPLLLIQPIWTFICLLIFLAAWVAVTAFIVTCEVPTAYKGKVKYEPMMESDIFFWYYIVGLIWTSEFILAAQQFVIGSAVSMWYFSRDKPNACCSCLVSKAVCRLILHHIGTIAFGSFIITLVKIPRYILMYIHTKFKDSESALAKCCLKCCICCLYCLEKILKYLHQNAYTITAIEGRSFCPSAKRAFGIIASNALRVFALNSVGDFVLFLAKIGVMASTCAIAVLWFRTREELHFYALPVLVVSIAAYFIAHCLITIYEELPGLHYFAIPVLFVSFASYLIAHCFISVYEMVVDALLLCFCVDCEINDGSPGREYYMSNTLMAFVEKSSHGLDVIDGLVKPEDSHPSETQPLRKLPLPKEDPVDVSNS